MSGYVYLLHFDRPISAKHTCQHYMGYTTDLKRRLTAHRDGRGARLCEVAKERGIGFVLARIWRGDRHLERKLKNQKSGPRLCHCCNGNLTFTLADVEEINCYSPLPAELESLHAVPFGPNLTEEVDFYHPLPDPEDNAHTVPFTSLAFYHHAASVVERND